MKLTIQFSFILVTTALISGCSGKQFSLQSYADDYFNGNNTSSEEQTQVNAEDKPVALKKSSSEIDDATTNSAIKVGPGAKVAGSSTYKKDKERGEKGAMQKSLDAWMEKEWEPTFEGDVNQTKQDKEANEHFTIQHYIDKAGKYMDKKEAEKEGQVQEPSHYETINKLPVIGN